ncbi:protein-L-isoaspartate O-methyltransferase [Nonomuraea sp. NPDC051941]|uniref:protein-L-isoaspartate O-methyltransferase n=1 Tax=Nonomuraea sp. NPDC051941 TaxID=3364373 RepID=UPI0037C97F4D
MFTHIAWRLDAMIAAISDHRPPLTRPIEQALRAVPRHWFVPPVGESPERDGRSAPIDREADPPAWWDAVYAGRPIVAADGCSCPAPSAVADLLELLGPAPGQRVLEVGTRTGWTAALLCRLVGQSGSVTSIEADPTVAEQGAKNLAAAGALPHLVVGDGTAGWAERAPYDGVHATYAVRTVPYAWIAQTRPGGVVVAPYGDGHALRLVVGPDGTAGGRFSPLTTMTWTRHDTPPGAVLAEDVLAEPGDARRMWADWGEPERERFGVTITPDGQRVWLDSPERVIG